MVSFRRTWLTSGDAAATCLDESGWPLTLTRLWVQASVAASGEEDPGGAAHGCSEGCVAVAD